MESSRSSRTEMLSLVVLCFVATSIPFVSGTCTYPSDLIGLWYTTHESVGELTWSSENVTSFTYQTTGATYTNLMHGCLVSDGTYYVSKTTTTITLFSAQFYVYTCWEFTKLSANKYLYRQAVSEESQVNNARVKVFPSTTTITQVSEICDHTTYDNHEYSILLRNGSISTETVSCPDPLLATGVYTISDSSTSYCYDNSWLDVCSDTTTVSANYTLCSTNIFYSASGTLNCVHHESFSPTEPSTYYVTLFNSDSSTDQSSTYIFTCAVVASISNAVYITQYPGECLNSTYMNATYISESTGFSTVLQTNTTCAPESTSDLGLILGMTFGILILIIILVVIGFFCFDKYAGNQKTSRSNSKVVPDTLPNTSMTSHGDKNYRMMFTPAPPRSAVPGGRHEDYYDGGRGGSAASLRPTISQLANIRTPTPQMSSGKDGAKTDANGVATIPDDSKVDGEQKKTVTGVEAAVIQGQTEEGEGRVGEKEKAREETEAEMRVGDEGKTTGQSDNALDLNSAADSSQASVTRSTEENKTTVSMDKRADSATVMLTNETKSKSADDNIKSPERRVKTALTRKTPTKTQKDMDNDSILDFDSKRIGEPDGAESGVMVDIEGSIPVFSESGDLTPEPTRITPRGQINPPRRPKPTPRGMAL